MPTATAFLDGVVNGWRQGRRVAIVVPRPLRSGVRLSPATEAQETLATTAARAPKEQPDDLALISWKRVNDWLARVCSCAFHKPKITRKDARIVFIE